MVAEKIHTRLRWSSTSRNSLVKFIQKQNLSQVAAHSIEVSQLNII